MQQVPATASVLDKVMLFVSIAVPVGIALGIFLPRCIFYDERLNMHFLQMCLLGLRPHHDFFCPYPAAFYVLFWPLRALIIDKPISILLLRELSIFCLLLIGISAIYVARKLLRNAMIAAVTFLVAVTSVSVLSIFSEARSDGLSAVLAVLSITAAYTSNKMTTNLLVGFTAGASILINPKYIIILGLVLIAVCVSNYLSKHKARLGAVYILAGIGTALVFGQLLCQIAGTNLPADIRQSAVLNMRFWQYVKATGNSPVEKLLYPYAIRYPHVIILWGFTALAYVIQCFRKKWDRSLIVSLAVLSGASLSWIMASMPFRQYLVPGIVASVIPMGLVVSRIYGECKKALKIAFPVLLIVVSVAAIALDLHRNKNSYSFMGRDCSLDRDLAIETALTEIIPRNEKVLSVAFPWTRRHVSYLMFDEAWGNPPGFEQAWLQVYPNDERGEIFSANHIISVLTNKCPALISMYPENVPNRWQDEIVKYVNDNENRYMFIEISERTIGIRKDLIDAKLLVLKLR